MFRLIQSVVDDVRVDNFDLPSEKIRFDMQTLGRKVIAVSFSKLNVCVTFCVIRNKQERLSIDAQ